MWLRLHRPDGTVVVVNADNITTIFETEEGLHDGNATIIFVGSKDAYIDVTETVKEITQRINQHGEGCF